MKTVISLILFSIISLSAFSQLDTIYSNNKRIPCSVKKVGEDAVTFVYPGEDAENSLDKNAIQQIIFKSGRVQKFAEATSYKTVNGVEDFNNVALTNVESEVKGLFKLGDVSSKARGTTTLSSMEKVKERANRKMKIVAAMMGANIIYLTSNSTNQGHGGTYFEASQKTSTNLSGVAYSNKLPSYDDFIKIYGNRTAYLASQRIELSGSDADYSTDKISKNVQIYKVYNESDLIMVNAKIDGVKNELFRVSNFSNDGFTLVWKDGDDIFNWIILNPQPTQQQTPIQQQNTTNSNQMNLPNINQGMVLPKIYKPQVGDTVSMEEYNANGKDMNLKGFGIITGIHDTTHWIVTYVLNGQNTTGFYEAGEMAKVTK